MNKIMSILILSVGSVLVAFGAFALYISISTGREFDALEFLQAAITLGGIVFMAIGIRNNYVGSPKLSV